MWYNTDVPKKHKYKDSDVAMKRYDGLVLCSDVDGTLIDKNNRVPKENIEAIEYFRAHGGRFLLVTGRIPEAVMPILPGITTDYPSVCHNGASLYDFHTRQYIDTAVFTASQRERVKDIIGMVKSIVPDTGIEVMTPNGICVVVRTPATDHHITFEKITADYAENIEEVTDPWLKILFAQKPEETEKIKETLQASRFSQEFLLVKTHQYYYEVLRKDVSKGTGIEKLCQRYGIDAKNLIAIGDNDNDVPMFSVAGISAATCNAPENVKKKANIVTCTNDDGAIADLITKL